MKKFIYIGIVTTIIWSCGGGGVDPEPLPTPETNKAPTTPTQVYPSNNLLCIDNAINFQWNSSTDPEGGAITYQIEVATDNQFGQIAHSLSGSALNQSISLEKGIAYYWRVKAIDIKNLPSGYSSTFNFYTEGVGETNHLPFTPELVKPNLNSVIQTSTAKLEWNASDVDTNDNLTFDVYFDGANPPTTKIGVNQTAKTLDVNLEASKSYYWKVVVKDNNGGETIGQIWNFKTD